MKIKNLFLYSFAITFLGLAIALRISWIKPETKIPRNQPITFMATVKTEPRISETNQVIRIGDARVYVDLFPRYRVGDRLKVSGEADEYGNIYRAQVERVGEVAGNWSLVTGLRNKISQNIKQLLPAREATLVVGSVLGVDDIERGFRDELIKTGTIHVVVVSGQNLAIVAGLFMALSRFIGRRQSLLLATVAVFLYAILTGFEPPVIRASLMVLASSLAIYLGREVWPILNIFIAALVIVFIWPSAIFEISFQLTFAATLGIATLGQIMTNFAGPVSSFLPASARSGDKSSEVKGRSLSEAKGVTLNNNVSLRAVKEAPFGRARTATRKIIDSLIRVAAIPLSAYIFTAPIIFYHFGRVSLIGPLANVLVAEAVGPVMILGFVISVASLIFLPFAQLLAYLAYVPAFYFVKVVEILARF